MQTRHVRAFVAALTSTVVVVGSSELEPAQAGDLTYSTNTVTPVDAPDGSASATDPIGAHTPIYLRARLTNSHDETGTSFDGTVDSDGDGIPNGMYFAADAPLFPGPSPITFSFVSWPAGWS